MKCPVCGEKAKVLEVRRKIKVIKRWRRYEYSECLTRFSTQETIIEESLPDYVRKKARRH